MILRRWVSAALLGIACALAGGVFFSLPWGAQIEQSSGLRGLFLARGVQSPPHDVVVIAITRDAANTLGLPYKTERWPRSLHAQLIDGLRRAGADTIVFDLLFRQAQGEADALLAEAMQRAGNVLLLEFLDKSTVDGPMSQPLSTPIEIHRLVPPLEILADAALATGPFTLPKVPIRVAQYWTFDANAGDAPSLPLVTLLAHARRLDGALHRAGISSLLDVEPGQSGSFSLLDASGALQQRLRADASFARRLLSTLSPTLDQEDQALLRQVLAALSGPSSRFVNFFGPPWTVRTVPYDEALNQLVYARATRESVPGWQGATVFVGLSSPVQWEQLDEFVTPFSDPDTGHDLSGIEILATAFANLRAGNSIHPLPPGTSVAMVLGWGMLAGLVARLAPPMWGALLLVAMTTAYAALAYLAFGSLQLWLPLITPLAVQVPMAAFGAVLLHYAEAKRERQRIRDVFGHYLPEPVVDQLARQGLRSGQQHETVFGVCLYTDAEQYTSLSEDMQPDSLADFLNAYYEVIFEPVRRRGGIISDVVGDAMMAIWATRGDESGVRAEACQAALEICAAVAAAQDPGKKAVLPTRIGVHCGTIALAHVGAADHYEFRAVGDIVNTASRLEGLNKQLNTQVLVSADMLLGIDAARYRNLGSFTLPGKRVATDVCELVGWEQRAP